MHSSDSPQEANIREALPSDAPRIAALCVQLGYDVPVSHVERSLGRRDVDGEMFVAVVARVGVVGWVAVNAQESILTSRAAEVRGLVVEDEYRGIGVGALLLARAERWARERGCPTLFLRSNVVRDRAHAFYERCGYARKKSQHVFEKQLA
ncbi:MAG TPA: GNAT family N-acetyltransferase [Candidatus Baltobacteraceae bacterium]